MSSSPTVPPPLPWGRGGGGIKGIQQFFRFVLQDCSFFEIFSLQVSERARGFSPEDGYAAMAIG